MAVQPRLHIEGVRELNRLLKATGDKDLPKELGQVHKKIGEMVIRRLGGTSTGVGEGRGENIRPSAAKREVLLNVGGSHRRGTGRKRQWGLRQVWPGGRHPDRPHLIGAAMQIQDQIEREYMDGVEAVIRRAGLN
jgi:hypothetical protein